MATYILMTRPARNKIRGRIIDAGNGRNVLWAHNLASTTRFGFAPPVVMHGFAATDYLEAFGNEAATLGACLNITAIQGTTRIDEAVWEDGEEILLKGSDSYDVSWADLEAMLLRLKRLLRPKDTLVITGSCPQWADGVDGDKATYELYIGLIRWCTYHGVDVALDVPARKDPEDPPGPLELIFASDARPNMVKMNRGEWEAVVAQLRAGDPAFAARIDAITSFRQQWLVIAERLMPYGQLIVSMGKHTYGKDEAGNAWKTTFSLPEELPDGLELVTKVGRGDTVMGVLVAFRGRISFLEALIWAVAARAAQTLTDRPGHFLPYLVSDWRQGVTFKRIARVEMQPVGSRS